MTWNAANYIKHLISRLGLSTYTDNYCKIKLLANIFFGTTIFKVFVFLSVEENGNFQIKKEIINQNIVEISYEFLLKVQVDFTHEFAAVT